MNISIYFAIVIGMSLVSLTVLTQTILYLRTSTSFTLKAFANLLLGICIEILLATIALFFLEYGLVWMLIKVVGRLIEVSLIVRFLNIAKRN